MLALLSPEPEHYSQGSGVHLPVLPTEILDKLKDTPEQRTVVGPLVAYLVKIGWKLDQIVFGRDEWRVPKTPSEATRREKGRSFEGYPVDIAVFSDPDLVRDYRHVLFIVECKQPDETAGIAQLETYFANEPHTKLGAWCNDATPAQPAVFVYRQADGRMLLKRQKVSHLPRPDEPIQPEAKRIAFDDLINPSGAILHTMMGDMLNKVVITDSHVTRREEQLDQVCNLVLLKLASDKKSKNNRSEPVSFRPLASASKTARAIREAFASLVNLYPGVFTTEQDKHIRFSDETIAAVVEELADLRLIDLGVSAVSTAFQVLRSAALKQGEGQFFTPQAVIEAGVRLVGIDQNDIIIDPACGTGGFLVQCLEEIKRNYPLFSIDDLADWARVHVHGIETDAIGVKLTKAVMQIAGDGSANIGRGDSVRTHRWINEFPHLASSPFTNGRFTVVITNPPFGKKLRVSATDCRLSHLDIAKGGTENYQDMEIGLIFLQRSYQLLKKGGRLGIILPESYFFSSSYGFVFDWLKRHFRPLVVANIPMDAFHGFCRAKTNFYVFEKINGGGD